MKLYMGTTLLHEADSIAYDEESRCWVAGVTRYADADRAYTLDTASAADLRITKRAFQNRFPKMPDGVSTKYDDMAMFLTTDEYASTLVADLTTRTGLRRLITAGVNRLNASPWVDLAVADAANFTGLLLQAYIPAAFRLTMAERSAILSTTIADGERFRD